MGEQSAEESLRRGSGSGISCSSRKFSIGLSRFSFSFSSSRALLVSAFWSSLDWSKLSSFRPASRFLPLERPHHPRYWQDSCLCKPILSFSSIRRRMLLKLTESVDSRLPSLGLGDSSAEIPSSLSPGSTDRWASSSTERKGPWTFSSSMALLLISAPSLPQRSIFSLRDSTFLRMVEFQWFLMQLSVLPGRSCVSLDHLLPMAVQPRKSSHSSSGVQSARLMAGLRWLYQRSRHCLPSRPGMCLAICDHLFAPHRPTAATSSSSSFSVHDRFGKSRLWMNACGGLLGICAEPACLCSMDCSSIYYSVQRIDDSIFAPLYSSLPPPPIPPASPPPLPLEYYGLFGCVKIMIKLLLLLVVVGCHSSNQQLQVTYVTGLWDLARGDLVLFKRNFDYYLNFLKDILQSDLKIIMFGNEEVRAFAEAHVKHPDRFHFVDLSLQDIASYWYTAKVGQQIDSVKQDWLKWQHYSVLPQYALRMYNPVVFSKSRLLMEAARIDPFGSDYLVWIDGGFTHSIDRKVLNEDALGRFFRNYQADWLIQVGINLPFHPFEVGFRDDGRSYANITAQERQFVWGNWLGGKAVAASTAYHIFENFLRFTLEQGEMNTDEALFFLMVERYSYFYHKGITPLSSNLTINSQIVEEKYALREIRAGDVLKYSQLVGREKAASLEAVELRNVYHLKNDFHYFKSIQKALTASLQVRLAILVGLVFFLAYWRRSMSNFGRLNGDYQI